jgi:S1-C subfamily serine protease
MAFRAFVVGFVLCSCSPAYAFSLPRNPTIQYEHAARIEVTCSYRVPNSPDDTELSMASGVFVSNKHVLTNDHVVTCTRGEDDKDIGRVTEIEVVLLDGTKHPAIVDVALPDRDIARVALSVPLENDIRSPGIGTNPVIGDRICFATAVPRYSYKCATVEPTSMVTRIQLSTVQAEHGNSGSAASDNSGRLVGLLRAFDICEFGIPCMGQITPITASDAWLVR